MTDNERTLTKMRIMKRIRRKLEIMKLDRKAQQDSVYHDVNELIALLDMLERTEKE